MSPALGPALHKQPFVIAKRASQAEMNSAPAARSPSTHDCIVPIGRYRTMPSLWDKVGEVQHEKNGATDALQMSLCAFFNMLFYPSLTCPRRTSRVYSACAERGCGGSSPLNRSAEPPGDEGHTQGTHLKSLKTANHWVFRPLPTVGQVCLTARRGSRKQFSAWRRFAQGTSQR